MEIVSKNMEEVKEEVNETKQQEVNAPTYEQLKNWCDQLLVQRNQLAERLGQITDIHNKLPWLFKVIENREIFGASFVTSCVEEVEYILTPPEQSGEPDTTKTESTKD